MGNVFKDGNDFANAELASMAAVGRWRSIHSSRVVACSFHLRAPLPLRGIAISASDLLPERRMCIYIYIFEPDFLARNEPRVRPYFSPIFEQESRLTTNYANLWRHL